MLRRRLPPSPVRLIIDRNFNHSLLVSSSSSFFSVNKQQQEQEKQNQTAKLPPSFHPKKLQQAKQQRQERRKPAVATFVEEEAENLETSSPLPSTSTLQNAEEEHVSDKKQAPKQDEINNKNQKVAPDDKRDPFSKPKSWSSSSSSPKLKSKQADKQQQVKKSKSNKNLGGKQDIQTISKVRKSLLDQFPDIYQETSSEGEDQQIHSSSSSVLQFLSPERQQELRKQDPQYEITLKERVDDYFDDENSTSTGGTLGEEQQQVDSSYQNLGINDITAATKSDDDTTDLSSSPSSSLLAHPDELNLTDYQRKLLQEKRSEEYGVLRRNFLKVFEGHHDLANKCHLLSALHEKVVERRMRLSTDVYEDFFLTFVRYGDSIMNTHKEGQVLPHFATSGSSSSSSSSIKNRATASSLSSVSQLRKIERQLHLLQERRRDSPQQKSQSSSFSSSSSSSLLKARTSSLHVSDFGFAEVVWSAYNYMLASGTKSSHRILQHVMRCLQFGGVQGGRAELERRAHQVLMDNCDPRAIAARQQSGAKRASPIVPTTYTLISYIEICAEVGSMHVALAMYIHALNEFRLTPDAVVTTVLLNGFLKNHFEWVRKQQQQEQQQQQTSSSPHLDSAIRFMRHIHSVPMDVILLNTMLNVLRHSKEPVSCFSAMRVVTGEESVLSEQREQVAFPIQAHTITTLLEAWNSCLNSWFPTTSSATTTATSSLSPPSRRSDKQNDDGNEETSTSDLKNNNNNENENNNATTKVPQYLRHHLTADDSLSAAGSIASTDTRIATLTSSSTSLLSFHEKQEELDQRQFNQNWNRAQILARELRFILTLSVKNQIKMSASTSAKLHHSASQLVVLAQELKRSLLIQKEKLLAQQEERDELLFVSQQQQQQKQQRPNSSEDEESNSNNNNNNTSSKPLSNNNHMIMSNSLKGVKNKIKRNEGQTDVLDKIEKHFSGVKRSLSEQMKKRGLSTYLEEKRE